MPQFTRRRFLITAASVGAASAAATVAGPPGTAHAASAVAGPPGTDYSASGCTPSPVPPGMKSASGKLGDLSATVKVRTLPDFLALDYVLRNIGASPDTFTVYYVDTVTSFDSRQVSHTLAPGQEVRGRLYAALSHEYLFTVDLSDGQTLTLGPMNRLPGCRLNSRKFRRPIYLPPQRPTG